MVRINEERSVELYRPYTSSRYSPMCVYCFLVSNTVTARLSSPLVGIFVGAKVVGVQTSHSFLQLDSITSRRPSRLKR